MYNISFARRLVSSQNSWPRCCNRLIKTFAWKRLDSRFMSTYFEHTYTKKNPRTNNFKIMQKYSSVITIERFLVQNFANYRTMAEISTAKNSLPKSPTELEKDGPSFSSLFSLARACATADIAPLRENRWSVNRLLLPRDVREAKRLHCICGVAVERK